MINPVLMLGWEFPPLHSGGLGVATKNIALALVRRRNIPLCFALPAFAYMQWKEHQDSTLGFEVSAHTPSTPFEVIRIASSIATPYHSQESYDQIYQQFVSDPHTTTLYGKDLFQEVERYAHEMQCFAKKRNFSLVHGHDWMTFCAGIAVKKNNDIPFIAHIHATEMDRTGENPNQEIYERERLGMEMADRIITVSHHTKSVLMKHYGILEDRIRVVHNGVEQTSFVKRKNPPQCSQKKTVLFLGRLTIQKGADWFLKVAEKVLEKEQNIQFLIAGTGDMLPRIIDEVARKHLEKHIIPLGFLNEQEREKAFQATDLYMMPSVSEPFGLSAVEAAQRGIPVIMSKQSGAREVLGNSLVADFWDTDKMAHLVLSALEYPALHATLSAKAMHELQKLTWDAQVEHLHDEYMQVLA